MIRDNRLPHATYRLSLGKEEVQLAALLKPDDDIPSGSSLGKSVSASARPSAANPLPRLQATSASGECL